MANHKGLIHRAQSGDEEAFAELMRAYYAYVYVIVIGIVNDPNDAEEVVQDTFLSAYRRLTQLQDTAKFKSWLAEIARNRARDRLRKQRVDTILIDEVSEHTLQTPDTVENELIRDEQRELIRRAMDTLSETDREIARAYYLEGASYDELIQTHGLSYKAISVRLSRAKQKLARRLKHLLTAIFLPPATTLKQIYSGGLIAMKIGTAPKITVGAIGIIALLSVGVHQIISPKFFGSKDNVASVQTEAPSGPLVETETNPETKDGVKQPQISDKDMAQINNFFAQFDDAGAQSDAGETEPSTESNTEYATTDTDAASEHTERSAEEVMAAYLEAFKNYDIERLLPLVIGSAKEHFEGSLRRLNGDSDEIVNKIDDLVNKMDKDIIEGMSEAEVADRARSMLLEATENQDRIEKQKAIQELVGRAELVSSEYVGAEFHFRLKIPIPKIESPELPELPELPDTLDIEIPEIPEMPELPESVETVIKMQKVDGAWRIYNVGGN